MEVPRNNPHLTHCYVLNSKLELFFLPDSSVTEKKAENEAKNVNGNSKSSSNGTGFEKSKSKHTVSDLRLIYAGFADKLLTLILLIF